MKLIRDKAFIIGFLLNYLLFFIVTVLVMDIRQPAVGAGNSAHGFPFVYYTAGCFNFGTYIWSGLIGNIVFAFFLSFIVGCGFAAVWVKLIPAIHRRISSVEFQSWWREFRAKYYL